MDTVHMPSAWIIKAGEHYARAGFQPHEYGLAYDGDEMIGQVEEMARLTLGIDSHNPVVVIPVIPQGATGVTTVKDFVRVRGWYRVAEVKPKHIELANRFSAREAAAESSTLPPVDSLPTDEPEPNAALPVSEIRVERLAPIHAAEIESDLLLGEAEEAEDGAQTEEALQIMGEALASVQDMVDELRGAVGAAQTVLPRFLELSMLLQAELASAISQSRV